MTRHRAGIDIPKSDIPLSVPPTDLAPPATAHPALRSWLLARIRGRHLDAQIDSGAHIGPGGALAAHATRITSTREREQLARALRSALSDEHNPLSLRVPVNRAAVSSAAPLIDEVALRLHAPQPVRVRGMARLRLLLADGRGPLYRTGRGSLNAQLRGVLAAL
jgi:hypothetical protein